MTMTPCRPAPKPSAVEAKQRNLSNDDFEPRPQFPQFYHQPYAAPAGQYPVPHAPDTGKHDPGRLQGHLVGRLARDNSEQDGAVHSHPNTWKTAPTPPPLPIRSRARAGNPMESSADAYSGFDPWGIGTYEARKVFEAQEARKVFEADEARKAFEAYEPRTLFEAREARKLFEAGEADVAAYSELSRMRADEKSRGGDTSISQDRTRQAVSRGKSEAGKSDPRVIEPEPLVLSRDGKYRSTGPLPSHVVPPVAKAEAHGLQDRLSPNPEGRIPLKFHKNGRTIHRMSFPPSTTVWGMKQNVAIVTNTVPSKIRLFFNKTELLNDSTIMQLGLQPGDTVTTSIKYRLDGESFLEALTRIAKEISGGDQARRR